MDTKKYLGIKDVEEITIGDRVRKEPGNIQELAESLEVNGQIQPIVLHDGALVAGFRRLCATAWLKSENRAIKGLEPGQILYIEKKDLTPVELLLIEFEENKARKAFSKAEEALAIARIKTQIEELEGKEVGGRRLAKLLGYSKAHISMGLQVAEAVEKGDKTLLAKKTIKGAYRDLKNKEKIKELMDRAEAREISAGTGRVDYSKNLHNGDAIAWLATIEDASIDLINFDPPWGIGIDSFDRNENYGTFDDDAETGITLATSMIPELYRIAADDSYMVVWFGIQYYQFLTDLLSQAGFKVNPVPYIWHKPNKAGAQNDPSRTTINVWEPFLLCEKGSPRFYARGGTNLLAYPMPLPPERIHYAQKSVDLLKDIIQRFSFGAHRVLDPTFGSGSFLVAGKLLGRQILGCEKDPKNHKNAIDWLRRAE